ncbi:peptide deformylase [uncultured Clostridium sp.]|jgi:peptide deformylase|uniref:peptide deformylase n=1 Tax=uncultured Clostridium sp. TaxID=59620 RepID=UPI00260182DA|nr:peptide deformylase [uncultured Clostridium sp.]
MALRTIRVDEDPILRKISKVVKEITPRTALLIQDMVETMREANGVGLAAPQVGILKRIFIVDAQDGSGHRIFVNPEIIENKGCQLGPEGCLSLPGEQGEVERFNDIIVKALDENGKEFVLEASELLARAIQHENDHLNGILFTDHVK